MTESKKSETAKMPAYMKGSHLELLRGGEREQQPSHGTGSGE